MPSPRSALACGATLASIFACTHVDSLSESPDGGGAVTGTGGTIYVGGDADGSTPIIPTDDDAGVRDAGSHCVSDTECEGSCVESTCTAPTIADGRVSPSLGETDVDCGGAIAPQCSDAEKCLADRDCQTGVCGDGLRCVTGPSCRGTLGSGGVSTCGQGEPAEPTARHESCCTSLALPASRPNRRLDRYEITSGRLRAFIADVSAKNAGVPNVRKFVTDFAADPKNSATQLASVATTYPGLFNALPDRGGAGAPVPLPVHLGAFPLDPINLYDGCYTSTGAYGHATYWQPESDVSVFGVGVNGVRVYSREQLDAKSVNCVMPLLLAAFCAWDGGELARTADYNAIWGRNATTVGTNTVYVPWSRLLSVSEFNWRNGVTQDTNVCTLASIRGWPGCVDPANAFYVFPALQTGGGGFSTADDASPVVSAPGRFALDVTKAVSGGRGWYDIGGNMMEAAWPVDALNAGGSATRDVCDVTATAGPGETACTRTPAAGQTRTGVRRYAGALPNVALVGYSFEGHSRRSERYLASTNGSESLIAAGDMKPVTFQYGKVGGRCARPAN